MAASPFSFQRSPAVTKRRCRWLVDGFMPPSFSKSLTASLGVQWSMESAVSGWNREITVDQPQAFIDRRTNFPNATASGRT